MTQYEKVNVKLSNTQLNKLMSAVNPTGVTLRLTRKMFESHVPNELLLTNSRKQN